MKLIKEEEKKEKVMLEEDFSKDVEDLDEEELEQMFDRITDSLPTIDIEDMSEEELEEWQV